MMTLGGAVMRLIATARTHGNNDPRHHETEAGPQAARDWCVQCHEWCYRGDNLALRCVRCALADAVADIDEGSPGS